MVIFLGRLLLAKAEQHFGKSEKRKREKR